MKQLLITIAAVLLVGCGPSEASYSLYTSITNGNIEAVEQHIAAGADVKGYGFGHLHAAAVSGNKEIVELLIEKGADVNEKLQDGATPLDVAIRLKRTEIANLLRKHGGKTGEELNRPQFNNPK